MKKETRIISLTTFKKGVSRDMPLIKARDEWIHYALAYHIATSMQNLLGIGKIAKI